MASNSRDKSKVRVSGPSLIPAGELAGRPPIALTRPITVAGSRNNCRLHLISRTVSKAHTLIVLTRHTVFVRDLASREGTFVNGEKVREQDLAEGDILKIGRFEFIFATGGAKLRPHREKQPPPATVRQINSEAPPVPLEARVTLVGRRGDADVAFLETTVSTAHAVLIAWEGKRYIRDLGSRTGTFVNGKKIHQQELNAGDVVRVGESDLAYEISTEGSGVEVVAAPSESAVARAIPAQEIESVPLSAEDTAHPSEKPVVAPPAARLVRPATPVADESVADIPVAPVIAAPLADSLAGHDQSSQADAKPSGEALPRRGWHRPGAEPAPQPEPAAEVLPMPAIEPEPEPRTPFDLHADTAEALADGVPLELELERSEVTSAATPAEVSAQATVAPSAEVIDAVDATPDSAQPLETLATGAGIDLPIGEQSQDLTDSVVNREIEALSSTSVGEPVVSAPTEPEPLPTQLDLAPESVSAPDVEPIAGTTPEPALETVAPPAEQPVADDVPPASFDDGQAIDAASEAPVEPEPAPLLVEEVEASIEPVIESPPPIILPESSEPSSTVVIVEIPQLSTPPAEPVAPVAIEDPVSPIELPAAETVDVVEPAVSEAGDGPAADIELSAPATPDVYATAALPAEPVAPIDLSAVDAESAGSVDEPAASLSTDDIAALLQDTPAAETVADVPEVASIESQAPTLEVQPELAVAPAVDDISLSTDPDPIDLVTEPVESPTPIELGVPAGPEAAANQPLSLDDVSVADAVEPAIPLEEAAATLDAESLAAEALTGDAPVEPLQVVDSAPVEPVDPIPDVAGISEAEAAAFAGELQEIAPGAESHETAFAVIVPPLEMEGASEPAPTPELTPAPESAAPVVLPLESVDAPPVVDELPEHQSPTDAPAEAASEVAPPSERPASPPIVGPARVNVTHHLGGLPLSMVAPPAVETGDANATIVPPPLPPGAPALSPGAEADAGDAVGPAAPVKARKSTVIRDGFNQRRRRPPRPMPGGEASPFAKGSIDEASAESLPADAFGTAAAGAFGVSIPTADDVAMEAPEPLAAPSDIAALPADASAALPMAELSTDQGQPGDAAVPMAEPRGRRARSPISSLPPAPFSRPVPGVAPAPTTEPQAGPDLHEMRRRRLRAVPLLLVGALLLACAATAGILWYFPVYSDFETALEFKNIDALTMLEQETLRAEQKRRLGEDATRKAALVDLRTRHPELSGGFLEDVVAFNRMLSFSGWFENRAGELVLRYRGKDENDRERLFSMASALYKANAPKLEEANRLRRALKSLNEEVETNSRKLADLRRQVEKERMLGESRPKAGEVEQMESEVLAAEKSWTDSLAKLKGAQAEVTRIEESLATARKQPPVAPENDPELTRLSAELADAQAEYKALQSRQSEQATAARQDIDAAMDSFQRQIEAARGQGASSPELAQYIAAAESLQKTTRSLLDELLERQQKQYQRLNELKAKLDEKAQQRAIELRGNDKQLQDLIEQREIARRQINAAVGSGLEKEEINRVETHLKLVESMIAAREELLSSDPLFAETIKDLQTIIDQTKGDIVADRKKADDKLDELQKAFGASSPMVANLPEEQKKLADELRQQLAGVSAARQRYADVLEADRASTEEKMKASQGRVLALTGEIESRRKLLNDELATRSVAALTTSLDTARQQVEAAQTIEAEARAVFESRGKTLRNARDVVAALQNSDERLARLFAERDQTENYLKNLNNQLDFRQKEAARLYDIVEPTIAQVSVTPGKDPRLTYVISSVGGILLLATLGVFLTMHSANRIGQEAAAMADEPAVPSPATPAAGKHPIDPNDEQPAVV